MFENTNVFAVFGHQKSFGPDFGRGAVARVSAVIRVGRVIPGGNQFRYTISLS